ncbi:MAG TPA: DUF2442 domain-containing protein [Candidatus Polarisedimenticolia bacterium]|nr:DUF2442 domain-containing protein [Candidatus Polarisedimenticolia bacterium]
MVVRAARAEVLQIAPDGLKVRAESREYFLDYARFPWLENAPVGQVLNVQMLDAVHLCWPDLGREIALESLTPLDPLAFLRDAGRDET